MNKYLDGILVVEGTSDSAMLSSFIMSPIFVTNGFEASNNLIKFLIKANEKYKIYILTDPDESGEKISTNLSKNLQNFKILSLTDPKFKNKTKHGVAELDYNYIQEYFKNYLIDENKFCEYLSASDICFMSCEKLSEKFSVFGNKKAMFKQLNILGIKKEDLL